MYWALFRNVPLRNSVQAKYMDTSSSSAAEQSVATCSSSDSETEDTTSSSNSVRSTPTPEVVTHIVAVEAKVT